MIVTLADGSTKECEDQHFAEGGVGRLYMGKDGKSVIKLFKIPDASLEATLKQIVGTQYNAVAGEPFWEELFAWPNAIITRPSLGLVMPRAPQGTVPLAWFVLPKSRKTYATQHGNDKLGSWQNYTTMAIKMARAVRRLHMKGLCHSDLSFNNFLVDPVQEHAVLIDCDGLVVPGVLPPVVLGTPLCMAPELVAQRTGGPKVSPTIQTDLHALATLIYWLLLRRHPLMGPKRHHPDPEMDEALAYGQNALFIEDPHDPSNHIPNLPLAYTEVLTPAVQALIKRAFVDGLHNPLNRPQATDWERALTRMNDSIIRCGNATCPVGYFILLPDQPATCPGCGMTNSTPLPILHFFRPQTGQKGHFRDDLGYRLVGTEQRIIYTWHVNAEQSPNPGVDQRPKAKFSFDKQRNKWYLHNLDLPEIHLLDSSKGPQKATPGNAVELTHGARVLFGPPDKSRLAYVRL